MKMFFILLPWVFAVFAETHSTPANHAREIPPEKTSKEIIRVEKSIDSFFRKLWSEKNVSVAEPATDPEFLRRSYLAIMGRIPTELEMERYLKLAPTERREKLCDELSDSSETASYWADLWTGWLLEKDIPDSFDSGGTLPFSGWLEKQIYSGVGFDKTVQEIISAKDIPQNVFIRNGRGESLRSKSQGRTHFVPATNRMARAFLGTHVECAQCHNSFFDSRFTQQRYWELNAFFRQTDSSSGDNVSDIESLNKSGTIYYQDTAGETYTARPKFLDGTAYTPSSGRSRREALAKMLTSSEDFPVAISNRVWEMLLGKSLNYPGKADDINDSTPIVFPEVAGILATKFKNSNFNFKDLLRAVCKTEVFGLSSKTPAKLLPPVPKKGTKVPKDSAHQNAVPLQADEKFYFQSYSTAALNPHQLVRSVEVGAQINPIHKRLFTVRALLYTVSSDGQYNPAGEHLKHAAMMNNPDINRGFQELASYYSKLTPSVALEKIFLQYLGRTPTEKEKQDMSEKITKPEGISDLLWAVLNSTEFYLNH